MDFNDITLRIKRAYNALDKQNEVDIVKHIHQEIRKKGDLTELRVSFGNLDDAEMINRIYHIVSLIAGMKDHLKNALKAKGVTPNVVENAINQSLELSLLLDLWNQEKHGYPLTKNRRSQKDPQIVNLSQGLTLKPDAKGNYTSGSIAFKVMENGEEVPITTEGEFAIRISGDVVDGEGRLIMKIDRLFINAMQVIEKILADYHLTEQGYLK